MKPPLPPPPPPALRRNLVFPALLLAAAALLALPGPGRASVDDSHSAAMEIAVEPVKTGFKIRQEYWKGSLKSGAPKMIKQQLFKGNEYWFFLGTDVEKAILKVDVYDRQGNKINVETKTAGNASAVRVLAPATGTYSVVFSITTTENADIPWALAYGYR